MRLLTTVLLVLGCVVVALTQFQQGCNPDVSFVVEISERLGESFLPSSLSNLRQLLSSFDLGPDKTWTSLVHFSTGDARTGVLYDLGSNTALGQAQAQIDFLINNIKTYLGISDLDLGLQYARDQVFVGNKDRPNAPNVVIILGEGFWDYNYPPPFTTAQSLRSNNVKIYSIFTPMGLDSPQNCKTSDGNTCYSNMVQITGDPSNIFAWTNTSNLANKIAADIQHLCATTAAPTTTTTTPTTTTTTPTTTTTQKPRNCACMDLIVIIDSSQSILEIGFNKTVAVVREMITNFAVSQKGVRIGIVTFNNGVIEQYTFDLTKFNSVNDVQQALDKFTYLPEESNAAAAFTRAESWFNTQKRNNVQQVIWFFSDGYFENTFPSPIPIANRITANGGQVIVVGFPGVNGDQIVYNEEVLKAMASTTNDFFHVATVTDLQTLEGRILADTKCSSQACSGGGSCGGDIVFVVETSERLGDLISTQSLPAVQSLVNQIGNFGDSNNRFALVTFSSPDARTRTHNLFNTANNIDSITNLINSLEQSYLNYVGLSDIDFGLQKVLTDVFVEANGDRQNVGNYVVLLGSGFYDQSANCCPSPFDDAKNVLQKTQSSNSFYAVALGRCQVVGNLQKIVGNPVRVYSIGQYQGIADQIKAKIQASCGSTECQCMDLIIILDSSESVTRTNFEKIRDNAIELVRPMNVGQSAVRVAVIVFSDDVISTETKDLNSFSSFDQFQQSVHSMQYFAGTTNTASALNKAKTWLDAGQRRSNTQTVIALYANDKHNHNSPDPVAVANQLRESYQAQILSIAVAGVTTTYTELAQIAGCQSEEGCSSLFKVPDIDQIASSNDAIRSYMKCSHTPCVTHQHDWMFRHDAADPPCQ